MALIKCEDCGKEVSSAATSCIGCGRPMSSANVEVANEEPLVVERKGGKYEMIGTLLILGSIVGCSMGMTYSGGASWMGLGAIGTIIGALIFLYGRFY